MKKLTIKEFTDRTNEVAKALRIFIPNFTTSVEEAFAIYQQVLADDASKHALTISKRDIDANKQKIFFSGGVDMACPDCGHNTMSMRSNVEDENGRIWNTALFCEKCLSIFYSEKTQEKWLSELSEREEQNGRK